jgi:hypothetical protein
MIVCYQAQSGLWSAAIPGTAIICHAVSKDACAAAIAAAVDGVDPADAMSSPVSVDAWRACLVASTVGALSDLRSDIDSLDDAVLAQSLATKIEWLEGMLRQCHEQQAELIRLQTEANEQRRQSLEIEAAREKRLAAIDAEHKKRIAEDAWLDVKVTEGPGGIEVVKLHRQFERWQGREPVFRKWSTKVATYPTRAEAPAEVVARIGKSVEFSRDYLFVPAHPYDRLVR